MENFNRVLAYNTAFVLNDNELADIAGGASATHRSTAKYTTSEQGTSDMLYDEIND